MKFPKKLSKERISLLSPEDKAIYEKEWLQPSAPSNNMVSSVIDDFVSENNASDIAQKIIEEEMEKLYLEIYEDLIPREEFDAMLESMSQNVDIQLNEGAEGIDSYGWIKGFTGSLGWIGKLAGAGLALLGTGLTALVVAGKDKLAIAKLKYFMNRMVELTDQGVHKKKPWYSFLVPSKQKRSNMGEYNMGCFRMVQETADRQMTNAVMQAAHKLGYFSHGNMMSISNGEGPQVGGGLDAFNQNVLSKLNVINRK